VNKLLVPWVEQNGSIFTRDKTRVKLEKGSMHVQLAIAFNVGEVAKHIVELHNASLPADPPAPEL
jgi:hypothetical protein